MSGIVGIVNLDGAPVDRDLLGRMTDFMSYRGPDAQRIWTDGNVGFGHTMLCTTFEAETEHQPLTLDGKVWLTADARIDGREQLISDVEAKLETKLRLQDRSEGNGSDSRTPNDAELILYAYQAWGEDCVKHLIGDFAFAIWDSRERRLLCARDHFGVKPFYYAHIGNTFVFSNTLNCVRLHPHVSNQLNDRFIGDFLLFDMCRDPGITVFQNVARLLPAHCLTTSDKQSQLKRYWTLSANGDIRYRRESDYIDRFNELFDRAVSDRLRTSRVGVFMSGGLDSTTVATVAHAQLIKQSRSFDLRAYTAVYDKLFKDEERYYSGLVAQKLNMPIHYLVVDNYKLYERRDEPALQLPEPSHQPLGAISYDQCLQVASRSRVVLTGYGLDPLIAPSHSHGIDLIQNLRFGQLARDISWFVFDRGQLPRLGFRGWLKRTIRGQIEPRYGEYPSWLDSNFASRTNLQARRQEIDSAASPNSKRPEGYKSLTGPFWPYRFEYYDPGTISIACESRHPFFDVHLVAYLMAIPSVPWCIGKELIRRAMRGRLPDLVRMRPKAVLAGDPFLEGLRRQDLRWADEYPATAELANYVNLNSLTRVNEEKDYAKQWINMRPLSLQLWLEGLRS